jgi:tRNA threonylcarbamoyl adenosine modification protein (Sua5/YciO/YrdC/YwlC family)
MHPKRKTVGLRVPENVIAQTLLQEMGEPLMSTTLILPGQDSPMIDPDDIAQKLQGQVDVLIDGGFGGLDLTTMLDMSSDPPVVMRQGVGNIDELLS